ncbi:hypothetical protein [Wohlfahrtiimonas chitiniclastica]|uniref:hypothetical protein n=1 Tax=Wohlfahrtiimonas chitiniclastica TaxID=400946 RepID=UPI001BCF07E4|nr:hypothetical protein [Wohlfahrtiimonas chitiniclastica]MBS7837245.1 hypothetical protein [Wohlfahrtiimonas chitiniclastica]
MIEHGVIKKDGEVVGYRTPKSELFIEQKRKQVAERRSTREKLKQADKALEAWARWRLTSIGYGDSPMATMDNPRVPPKSTPPIGCHEAPEIVLAVIRAFEQMKNGDKVNRRYAVVLSQLYMERREYESIAVTVKRLGSYVSLYQIRRAKEKLFSIL